jgi:hypothetical protein
LHGEIKGWSKEAVSMQIRHEWPDSKVDSFIGTIERSILGFNFIGKFLKFLDFRLNCLENLENQGL